MGTFSIKNHNKKASLYLSCHLQIKQKQSKLLFFFIVMMLFLHTNKSGGKEGFKLKMILKNKVIVNLCKRMNELVFNYIRL